MSEPIPMLLWCPSCGARHIDAGEFATKPHHTHACQSCGMCWRPAVVHTVGVQFLPGFRNAVALPVKREPEGAQEIGVGEIGAIVSARVIGCTCPATSEYDDPCPRHGVLGIGVRGT